MLSYTRYSKTIKKLAYNDGDILLITTNAGWRVFTGQVQEFLITYIGLFSMADILDAIDYATTMNEFIYYLNRNCTNLFHPDRIKVIGNE